MEVYLVMIKVSCLSKSFLNDENFAVSKVSFTIQEGEVVCIVGASGCGKTTTLKMINGLISPTKGDVFVDGKDIKCQDPVEWRRNIGYVVQKGGLLPHLTVYENLSLLSQIMGRDKGAIKSRVQNLMDMVHMPCEEFLDRYPHELSGGQQQKISLIRALMEDPSVILMDEPFSAIDNLAKQTLYEEFILLNQKLKKTILFVSHNLKEAFLLADRVILMRKGCIEQQGTHKDFIENPKTQYVKQFIQGFSNES